MSITQTISALPEAPTRTDPANFASKADSFMTALEGLPAEENSLAEQMNTVAAQVENNKSASDASASAAESSATSAANAAVLALASANVSIFAAATTYAAGDTVQDPASSYTAYVSQAAGNVGHTPSADDGTWWVLAPPSYETLQSAADSDELDWFQGETNLTLSVPDALRRAVEAKSGGKNTIFYDDKGYPSVMVVVPQFNVEDIDAGLGTGIHPAFIVDGVEKREIFIGKYLASVHDSRALSLPNRDPANSLNYDAALTYCSNKGPGWHLMTNAEWAAIALWCWKNGTMPHGNNSYGRDYDNKFETARLTQAAAILGVSGTARTYTGSGPVTWSHDHTPDGIYDLNGNVYEWVGGLRLSDGEIQIIENNNAANNTTDQSSTSAAWKAIAADDGSLVAPGTVGSLKYDATNADGSGSIQIDDVVDNQSDGSTYASVALESMAADDGIVVPDILPQLALAPGSLTGLGSDKVYMCNLDERLPLRGGSWNNTSVAGVLFLNCNYPRSIAVTAFGFRPAFVI